MKTSATNVLNKVLSHAECGIPLPVNRPAAPPPPSLPAVRGLRSSRTLTLCLPLMMTLVLTSGPWMIQYHLPSQGLHVIPDAKRERSHRFPGVGCGHLREALFSLLQVPCEKAIMQRKKEESSPPSNLKPAARCVAGRGAHLPTLTQTEALSRKSETGRSYKQGSATPVLPSV